MAGLPTAFGSGAMSNSIEDIANHAKAIFVIGSNTTEQHPVSGMRLRQAVKQRGAALIVVDPRRIPLTDYATLHLRHKPGTDNALINGLMHIILDKGWEDQAFIAERTEAFEALKELVQGYPPDRVAEITGVPVEQLYQAAEIMGTTRPMAVLWVRPGKRLAEMEPATRQGGGFSFENWQRGREAKQWPSGYESRE